MCKHLIKASRSRSVLAPQHCVSPSSASRFSVRAQHYGNNGKYYPFYVLYASMRQESAALKPEQIEEIVSKRRKIAQIIKKGFDCRESERVELRNRFHLCCGWRTLSGWLVPLVCLLVEESSLFMKIDSPQNLHKLRRYSNLVLTRPPAAPDDIDEEADE
jgi:hypothetical protein